VHPRTLKLLNCHGIAHEFLTLGRVNMGARVYVNRTLTVDFDLEGLGFDDTAFPSTLFISQVDTETFLDGTLKRYGYAVERPVTAEKLEQGSTGVTAWLGVADRRRVIGNPPPLLSSTPPTR
jgi:hypothetical protein